MNATPERPNGPNAAKPRRAVKIWDHDWETLDGRLSGRLGPRFEFHHERKWPSSALRRLTEADLRAFIDGGRTKRTDNAVAAIIDEERKESGR